MNITSIGVDFISVLVHPFSRALTKNRVRILCYHRVCDLPQTTDSMQSLNVPPTAFDQQMAYLSRSGYNSLTLEQFVECKRQGGKLPEKTVIITFDDGYRDNCTVAFPILQRYDFNATFFVVTDYINNDKLFKWLKLDRDSLAHSQQNKESWGPLNEKEILDMSVKGACFGSHTRSHGSLIKLNEGKTAEELRDSKAYLEKLLSKPVTCLSYPYGELNKSVKSLVKSAGYKAAVGARGGGNTLKSDFFELRRTLIDGRDSFAKFKRKVEGAYDWFENLIPATDFLKRVIIPGGER